MRKLAYAMLFHVEKWNGYGLAAPQVGRLLRMFVVKTPDLKLVVINPEIIEKSEEMINFNEGCLSKPQFFTNTLRHKTIKIKFINLDGKEEIRELTGLEAVVCQHECEHMDGRMFDE